MAPIKQAAASDSFEELQDSLASMTSSPVTDLPEQNPVKSPQTLAAAAALDQSAVAPLQRDVPGQLQSDESRHEISEAQGQEAQKRLLF